jgi:hypothetical protein
MHQKKGFKFYLDTKNNEKPSRLDPAYVEHLNVRSLANLPYLFI